MLGNPQHFLLICRQPSTEHPLCQAAGSAPGPCPSPGWIWIHPTRPDHGGGTGTGDVMESREASSLSLARRLPGQLSHLLHVGGDEDEVDRAEAQLCYDEEDVDHPPGCGRPPREGSGAHFEAVLRCLCEIRVGRQPQALSRRRRCLHLKPH